MLDGNSVTTALCVRARRYFVAESITDAKDRMRAFAERDIVRGFNVRYNPYTQSVDADRAIVRSVYAPTLQKEGM